MDMIHTDIVEEMIAAQGAGKTILPDTALEMACYDAGDTPTVSGAFEKAKWQYLATPTMTTPVVTVLVLGLAAVAVHKFKGRALKR